MKHWATLKIHILFVLWIQILFWAKFYTHIIFKQTDHLLLNYWSCYHPTQTLPSMTQRVTGPISFEIIRVYLRELLQCYLEQLYTYSHESRQCVELIWWKLVTNSFLLTNLQHCTACCQSQPRHLCFAETQYHVTWQKNTTRVNV